MSLQILSEYRRRCKTASPLQVWQMMWHTLMSPGSIALMTYVVFFSANTTGSFNRRCLSCNLSCGYISGSFSPDANYFLLNCKGFMLFLCKTSVNILSCVKDFFNKNAKGVHTCHNPNRAQVQDKKVKLKQKRTCCPHTDLTAPLNCFIALWCIIDCCHKKPFFYIAILLDLYLISFHT